MTPEPKQISVSRDALRADLGDLELRLRTYFDAKIELKANADHVNKLEDRLVKQEAGEWTKAQELSIKDFLKQDDSSTWALKSNKMAWAVGLSSFAGLASSIVLTAHYLGWW